MFYFDVFMLGFITHTGLLLGSTLQVAYLLSRGLAGISTIPMAAVFVISSLIASGIAVFGFDIIISENEHVHMGISILGAIILLREAYKSYNKSKQNTLCCDDRKIYTVFLAISIMWLNPHIYADIVAISGIIPALKEQAYLSFYVGFNLVAFIWYFTVAIFAKQVQPFFRNVQYHKYMHILSSMILVLTAVILLLGVFGIDVFHQGEHNH